MDKDWWELASYVVTVVGLPFAIVVFLLEQRKERQKEDEEVWQRLSDEYMDFMKLVIDNPDLGLLRKTPGSVELTAEQQERKFALFNVLVAIFERAFILVYEDDMDRQQLRLWQSWEDYMREWCRRPDFRAVLPELLAGEDEDFARHISAIAARVSGGGATVGAPA